MRRAISPALLLLAFSACAIQQVSMEDYVNSHDNKRIASPPPGKGVIYIIRKPAITQMMIKFNAYLDGKKVGFLPNRSYLNFAVLPGEHKVTVFHPSARSVAGMRKNAGRGTFQVEEGKSYYLAVQMGAMGGVTGKEIIEAKGRKMVAKYDIGGFTAPVRRRSADRTAAVKIYSDIDTPGYQNKERPDDFAVVIGIDGYKDLPNADFAERDAQTMRDHLIAMGYPKRHVALLKGESATGNGMRKYVEEWLPRNVKPNSNVFFYYSGHGAPDTKTGKAYLVPWDGDAKFLKSTAYPVDQLYASLNALKAKRVTIALDSCFSGAGGRSVLAKGARPLVTKVAKAKIPEGKLVLFTAAAGDEITTTLEKEGHGIFTYFFIKGLQGAAKDAAGRITVKSLYRYLKPRVQDEARLQNRDQTPMLYTQSDAVLRSR